MDDIPQPPSNGGGGGDDGGVDSPIDPILRSSTGNVFFSEENLVNIEVNAENNAVVSRWLDNQFSRADENKNSRPNPLKTLNIEGNFGSRDAQKLVGDLQNLMAFSLDYKFNKNTNSLNEAEEYLLAWANTYEPNGNPIDEDNFIIYVGAYELVRDELSDESKKTIDTFLLTLYTREVEFMETQEGKKFEPNNNWVSRHLMLVTSIAFLSGDSGQISYVEKVYRNQLNNAIFDSGTFEDLFPGVEIPIQFSFLEGREYERGVTIDFVHRDALLYHIESVGPMTISGIIAKNNGRNWFSFTGNGGQKIQWAYDFVIPYARGEKTNYEFEDSLLSSDEGRETWFKPEQGIAFLTLGSLIDDEYSEYRNLETTDDLLFFLYAGSDKI